MKYYLTVFSDDLKSVEHFILCLLAICILVFGEIFDQLLRVCMCGLSVHMCVHVHLQTGMCGVLRLTSGCLSQLLSTLFFEMGFSLSLELDLVIRARLTGQQAQTILLSMFPLLLGLHAVLGV